MIIDNLVSNAVKYSGNNKIIKLSTGEKDGIAYITIEDDGVGIDNKDINKVFNPFFRSRDTAFVEATGSGIGLSIVQRICGLLNINILLESEKNKGTTVSLMFK